MRKAQHILYIFFLYRYVFYAKIVAVFSTSKKKTKNSVYYFSPFFEENAGYQWRTKKWAEILEENDILVTIGTAIKKEEFYSLYPQDVIRFQKIILKRRFKQVLESRSSEIVIVRRELLLYNDYGNLFLEKLLLHFHPNAILDFDDDISAAKNHPKPIKNLYGRILKEHGDKFNDTLKLFRHFIVASDYLKKLVEVQNAQAQICVIPTCVDYQKHTPKKYDGPKEKLILGWIGSDGNYKLLDDIIPDLHQLSQEFNFELLVIGGNPYTFKTDFPIIFKTWSLETEIEQLKKMDVGLMPLIDNLENRGKAGFKLIQYMGLGIVSVASPLTVNSEILSKKAYGFLVETTWYETLKTVFSAQKDFAQIGEAARERINTKYSFRANTPVYLDFIKRITK